VIHRSAGRIGDANQLIGAIVGIHEGLRHPAHRDGLRSEVPAGIVRVSGRTGSIPHLAEPTHAVCAGVQGHIQALVWIVDGCESVQGIVGVVDAQAPGICPARRVRGGIIGVGRGSCIGTDLLPRLSSKAIGLCAAS
jgi:hypothetical protein